MPDKTTTTVAMDFGRVTLDAGLILYLFGTPGQHRFWFMWDDLIQGAIGAVVLVDTRRLADSFPAVDYFETAGLPFIVAINGFHGEFPHTTQDVQEALSGQPERADRRVRRPWPGVHQGDADRAGRARDDHADEHAVTTQGARRRGVAAVGCTRVSVRARAVAQPVRAADS